MVSRNFNRGGIGEHVFSAMVKGGTKGEKPKGEEIGLRESIRRTIGGIEVPDDEVTTVYSCSNVVAVLPWPNSATLTRRGQHCS